MAVPPKVSIRKIGKSIASLGRRRVMRVAQEDYHSDNHDCHNRDGLSDSETLDSSIIMEDACSFRVDDAPPNQRMFPSRRDGVILEDSVSSSSCFEACTSPRMSSRKVLSPEDEARFSLWSSPSLRRRPPLTKMDSWLFLSSARGCAGGPGDDNDNNDNNERDRSEEITSEHEDDDVVPPMMMPVKRAVPKSSFPIDRRMAMQREDSWLTMRVRGDDDSPRCVQRLRRTTTRHHRGHAEMVSNLRRSIARPVTSKPLENLETSL